MKKVRPNKITKELVVFKQNSNAQLVKTQKIAKILKNSFWVIDNYQKQNWKTVFEQMTQCKSEQITFGHNKHSQLLKQIKHVQFPMLNHLWLSQNNIDNIQSLVMINFGCLERLSIGIEVLIKQYISDRNHINRITCLSKLSMMSLNELYLYQNPIFEINLLTRSRINTNKIQDLTLEFYDFKQPISEDLSLIVKLNGEKMNRINIMQEKRIMQQKIAAMLRLRYLQVAFLRYNEQQQIQYNL